MFAKPSVDVLEERSVPAVGAVTIQPPLLIVQIGQPAPLALIPTNQDAALRVRSDLFGGAHGSADPVDDPLIQREAQSPAADAAPAPPVANPDCSPAVSHAAEPIPLGVVLEYD